MRQSVWVQTTVLEGQNLYFRLFQMFLSRRNIIQAPGASHRKAQGRATTPARNRKTRGQTPTPDASNGSGKGDAPPRSASNPRGKQQPQQPHTYRPRAAQPRRGKPAQSRAEAQATIQGPCTKTCAAHMKAGRPKRSHYVEKSVFFHNVYVLNFNM